MENEEIRQLNNIRFNVDAFQDHPDALIRYSQYANLDQEFAKKRKTFEYIAWSGLALEVAGFFTMLGNNYDYSDPRSDRMDNISMGLLIGGACVGLSGSFGWASYNTKIKENKKDLIFYLKANHGGLGIVTIF